MSGWMSMNFAMFKEWCISFLFSTWKYSTEDVFAFLDLYHILTDMFADHCALRSCEVFSLLCRTDLKTWSFLVTCCCRRLFLHRPVTISFLQVFNTISCRAPFREGYSWLHSFFQKKKKNDAVPANFWLPGM